MKTHYLRAYDKTKMHNRFIASSLPKPTITKAEAIKLVAEIGIASTKIFKNVVLLVSTRGYIALGFSKPADCLRKRLPELSASYISRLLTATDIYLKLDPKLLFLNYVSEATFRPLQAIADAEAITVWEHVIKHYGQQNKRINSRHMMKAMEDLNIHAVNSKPSAAIHISHQLQPKVQHFVKLISHSLLLPNVHSRAEWRQFAKLIYQQLVEQCQFEDSSKVAAR